MKESKVSTPPVNDGPDEFEGASFHLLRNSSICAICESPTGHNVPHFEPRSETPHVRSQISIPWPFLECLCESDSSLSASSVLYLTTYVVQGWWFKSTPHNQTFQLVTAPRSEDGLTSTHKDSGPTTQLENRLNTSFLLCPETFYAFLAEAW